jgi:glucosyl-3-phosphoglycerate phosphatase
MTLLIRHAESEWNHHFGAYRIDAGLPDPSLTPAGAVQAEAIAVELGSHGLRRLVSSPYRRALQTATIIGTRLGLAITVEPLVRERCAFSCDQGSPPHLLQREWPHLDFSGLTERWWGSSIESMETLARRCDVFAAKLATWPEREATLIVSHWGFIRGLTGQELGNATWVRFALTPNAA